MFQYTPEQNAIFDAIPNVIDNGLTLKVESFAGTSKTTTAIGIVKRYPEKNFLYLAFNNPAAKDFNDRLKAENIYDKNCLAMTINALAWKFVKPKNPRGDYKAAEISELFNIGYAPANKALMLLSTYCKSSIETIGELSSDKYLVDLATSIYNKMNSGEIRPTHDYYVKEFALLVAARKVSLSMFNCVILDEAQDTNPVSIGIFESIKLPKVFIGDRHQGIYGFRGAVNAMDTLHHDLVMNLSSNFRSSKEIISKANFILNTFKGEPKKIEAFGNGKADGRVAHIARSNASIISLVRQYETFYFARGPEAVFAPILAIYYWDLEEDDKIPKEFSFLKKFKNRADLMNYIEASRSVELSGAVKLIESEQKAGRDIYDLYTKALKGNTQDSRIILTTAHGCKGLEFETVIIENDFGSLLAMLEDVLEGEMEATNFIEEVNLYYVAITRAMRTLEDKSRNAKLFNGETMNGLSEKIKKVLAEAQKIAAKSNANGI